MGMYTEIFINADLKEDTPENVLDILRSICEKRGHPEQKHSRWMLLFNNGSYYTPHTEVGNLTYDTISKQWSLLGKGDIKNYEGEIQDFFDWIKPWCEEGFIGYYRYEEDENPTLVYAP